MWWTSFGTVELVCARCGAKARGERRGRFRPELRVVTRGHQFVKCEEARDRLRRGEPVENIDCGELHRLVLEAVRDRLL